jgi:hypothetical protein
MTRFFETPSDVYAGTSDLKMVSELGCRPVDVLPDGKWTPHVPGETPISADMAAAMPRTAFDMKAMSMGNGAHHQHNSICWTPLP